MDNKSIKDVFSTIIMSEKERENLWEKIDNSIESGESERKIGKRRKIRKGRIAAAVLLLFISVAGLANVLTHGKLTEAMERVFHMSDSSKQIIKEASDYHVTLDSVYAPQIIDYDNNRLIFGGVFGLIVYDCRTERVVGTMDLEKIGCHYFNADTVQTFFSVEDNQLLIYNRKIQSRNEIWYSSTYVEYPEQKAIEKCYQYDLGECDRAALDTTTIVEMKPVKVEKVDRETDKKLKKNEIENFWKNYTYWIFDHADSYFHQNAYSEYSKIYFDETGMKWQACIVLDDGISEGLEEEQEKNYQLFLCCQRVSDKKTNMKKLKISLSVPSEEEISKLPQYDYQGGTEEEKALARCFYETPAVYEGSYFGEEEKESSDGEAVEDFSAEESDVVIPVIRVAAVKKGKKYTKVFGTFRWSGYTLSGKTLYESGVNGGSEGVAYLKETKTGYQVEKIIHPRDGGLWNKDFLKMADGDKKIVKKVNLNQQYDKLVGKILRKYVAAKQLDIDYYKSFGWDPIKISKKN